MKIVPNLTRTIVAGAALFALVAPSIASAGRYSNAPTYTGTPALQLTVNMIAAGTGNTGFDSSKLLGVLAGTKATAEIESLDKKFGAANVKSFLNVFDYVVSDSVSIVTSAKIPLPKPSTPAPSGAVLAGQLYGAGASAKGWDVEYMLDTLVTHPVHAQVMKDIDAKFGEPADANYHAVLTQAMIDLKTAYGF